MTDLLWGWLIILSAIAAVAAVLKWGLKIDQVFGDNDDSSWYQEEAESAWYKEIASDPDALEATQIISAPPLIASTDLVEIIAPETIPGKAVVVDELGEWEPWEHTLEQPHILADVLMTGSWEGLRANELGMVAA